MTTKTVVKLFATLLSVYGNRFDIPSSPGKARLKTEVWADLLSDVPDETGIAACRAWCVSHGDWPPTPADLRDIAQANLHLPTPGEAWAEAWEAACHHGYSGGQVPAMSHPEIQAAAKATPWFRICLANTESELSFAQRDFMRIYEGLCSRTERELVRAQIGGATMSPQLKSVDGAIAEIEAGETR